MVKNTFANVTNQVLENVVEREDEVTLVFANGENVTIRVNGESLVVLENEYELA